MYSTQTHKRQPEITVSDVITSRPDDIHAQLYKRAMSAFISYEGLDENDYRFVEVKSSYYDEPSNVCVINKAFPYTQRLVDLTPYWEEYLFNGKMSYLKLDDDATVETAEVVYRDYTKGYAELRSRLTGRTFKVPLKDLPDDIKDIDDEKSFVHSFTYKVKNKIYGID